MRILDYASAALSCSCKAVTLSGRTIVELRIGEDVKRGNRDCLQDRNAAVVRKD